MDCPWTAKKPCVSEERPFNSTKKPCIPAMYA